MVAMSYGAILASAALAFTLYRHWPRTTHGRISDVRLHSERVPRRARAWMNAGDWKVGASRPHLMVGGKSYDGGFPKPNHVYV